MITGIKLFVSSYHKYQLVFLSTDYRDYTDFILTQTAQIYAERYLHVSRVSTRIFFINRLQGLNRNILVILAIHGDMMYSAGKSVESV